VRLTVPAKLPKPVIVIVDLPGALEKEEIREGLEDSEKSIKTDITMISPVAPE
jgi:hypothetical protein